jgi:four helix bundle protein
MKDNHFNFEDLKVYRKSLELMDQVYETTLQYPGHERFNLTSQFRRAALSISLNIAEGSGATNKQNLHFLDIATRSLKECVVCTTVSQRRGYTDDAKHNLLRSDLVEIKKMISGLRRCLSESKS